MCGQRNPFWPINPLLGFVTETGFTPTDLQKWQHLALAAGMGYLEYQSAADRKGKGGAGYYPGPVLLDQMIGDDAELIAADGTLAISVITNQ
jgi:hypothetical protein